MTISDILLPYQKKFLMAKQKRKLWISSRQAGKSFTLAFSATQKALSKKDGLSLIVSTGARAASEMLRKCVNFAEAVKKLSNGKIDYTNSADAIKFSNGSRILSLPSGNPAALRGFRVQCVVLDEAAFIEHPEDVLAAIAPTLTRDPDSELLITSTPTGRNSWFYKQYEAAKNDPNWYVQETTIFDAKEQGLDVDINNLKTLTPDPDVWKMEYCCEFLNEYGSMIDVDLLIFDEITTTKGPYFLGMDVGSTNDRTVFAILEKNTIEKKYKLIDLVVMHKSSYQEQLDMLKNLNAKYKFQKGYIDSVGIGSPIAEFAKNINRNIAGFFWTATNKTPAYEDLRACIFDQEILFNVAYKSLLQSDFRNVQKIITNSGQIRYQAGRNENGHSDATSALVLALQAAKQLKTVLPPMAMFNSSRLF